MTKPAVAAAVGVAVYLLISFSLVVLFLLSRHNPMIMWSNNGGRKLYHHHVAFDPLVDEMERRVEEEKGSIDVEAFRENLKNEFGMLEYYFGEEGSLNTTERLMYLFPLLDQSPTDGVISREELEVWNRRQTLDRMVYITERQMQIHDTDRDGEVTLAEFLSYIPKEERDWNDKRHGKPGWWMEQFENADGDANGSLNETEFNDFLNPEDSSNPKIQQWMENEKLKENDQDEDGKLDYEEFHGLYIYYPALETAEDGNPLQTTAEEKFAELDVNNDEFLTIEELMPIIRYLNTGELSHATHYTEYLMNEADDNKDGKLTLKEMINHHHAFYNAVFEEVPDDYDVDDHDEF